MRNTTDDISSLTAYNKWHSALEWDTGESSPWHSLVQRHLNPEQDLMGRRILEIGCGRGGFAVWLARHRARPAQVVAADFSTTAVAIARKLSGPHDMNIEWMVQDIQALQFETGTFDTVISCETIEHVPEPARAVRELARVLRPGGRLFITTPNYMNAMGLYRGYLRVVGRPFSECGQPINNLTSIPRTLAWIRRAGLDGKVVGGTIHPMPVPGRPPVNLAFIERLGALSNWIALHPLIIARKHSFDGTEPI